MSDAPSTARAVVIGCGIVGNSLAYHLTRLGWTDIVLLDKGPLPNPGGSTGHASNFIFLVDHSKEMTQLTLDSVRQYREMDVFTECGGIEVARTEERMEELRRRMASAKAWGIEPVSLVTPAEIKELVPYIDESILLGGFHTPGVGVVDSLRAGTIMRERGIESGGLTVLPNTEVNALGVEGDRIRRVKTSKGTIEAETVIVACGVWSPLLAGMAGARIPLVPMVHQMIDVGPVPRFEKSTRAIEFPIVRDMDVFMYERQDGTSLEIGSYAHRSIVHDPEEIPSIDLCAYEPISRLVPSWRSYMKTSMSRTIGNSIARELFSNRGTGPTSIIWCTIGTSGMCAPAIAASSGLQTPQATTTVSASIVPFDVSTRRIRPPSTPRAWTSVFGRTVIPPDSMPCWRMIVPA